MDIIRSTTQPKATDWLEVDNISGGDGSTTGTDLVISADITLDFNDEMMQKPLEKVIIQVKFKHRLISGSGRCRANLNFTQQNLFKTANDDIENGDSFKTQAVQASTERERNIQIYPALILGTTSTTINRYRIQVRASGEEDDDVWEVTEIKGRIVYLPLEV